MTPQRPRRATKRGTTATRVSTYGGSYPSSTNETTLAFSAAVPIKRNGDHLAHLDPTGPAWMTVRNARPTGPGPRDAGVAAPAAALGR